MSTGKPRVAASVGCTGTYRTHAALRSLPEVPVGDDETAERLEVAVVVLPPERGGIARTRPGEGLERAPNAPVVG